VMGSLNASRVSRRPGAIPKRRSVDIPVIE
jgi:hypothetical protein